MSSGSSVEVSVLLLFLLLFAGDFVGEDFAMLVVLHVAGRGPVETFASVSANNYINGLMRQKK